MRPIASQAHRTVAAYLAAWFASHMERSHDIRVRDLASIVRAARMSFVTQQNIVRFRLQLASSKDETQRLMLVRLLSEEQLKDQIPTVPK
jgi:hypothetical protein